MKIFFIDVETLRDRLLAEGLTEFLRQQGFDLDDVRTTPILPKKLVVETPAAQPPVSGKEAAKDRQATRKSAAAPEHATPKKRRGSDRAPSAVPEPPTPEKSGIPTQRDLIREAISGGAKTSDQIVAIVTKVIPAAPRNSITTQLLQLSRSGEIELSKDGLWRRSE